MRKDTPAYLTQWPGHIILPDALNFPQLIAWQDAVDQLAELGESVTWDAVASKAKFAQYVVKAFCEIVTEWHLTGLPEHLSLDTFPATPRVQSTLLIAWLGGVMARMFDGADDTEEKKSE